MRYSFLKLFLVLYTFLIKKKTKYCITLLGHLVKMKNLIFTLISKLVFYEVFADISQNQSMLMREIFFLVTQQTTSFSQVIYEVAKQLQKGKSFRTFDKYLRYTLWITLFLVLRSFLLSSFRQTLFYLLHNRKAKNEFKML